MAQVCDICSKGPIKARKITRRGKSKKVGGIGLNITGIALRRQMPNLQAIRAIVNGKPQRLLVCTRCLRSGKVQKRLAVPKANGPESSGKTTIALQIIAEAQRAGGMAAFVDAEHALDPGYAKKLGVDVDNLLVSQPD